MTWELKLGMIPGNLGLGRAGDLRWVVRRDDQTSGDPLKVGQKAGHADGPSLEGSSKRGRPLVAGGEGGTLPEAYPTTG